MVETTWTSTAIQRLFRTNMKSKQSLFNAEKKGDISTSLRYARGNTQVRIWDISQLPTIGERFGFLKKPTHQKILCFYTAKGGVLKTTLAYNFARILAINGIKTIIIGLDIQCSISDICLPPIKAESLEETIGHPLGLFHFLYEDADLTEVVIKTELPTLDIIPETPDLNILEKKLRGEKLKEAFVKNRVIGKLKHYDAVIFDNSPSWNMLIENALAASNNIISPVGCEIGTYHSLKTNLATIEEFKDAAKLVWENFFLVPTLLEKTKLSQQIYGAYLNEYTNHIIPFPIRRAIKGQEAILLKQSILEYDIYSTLAQDYYELVTNIWAKINMQP